jgi:5'-3' exonuclease
MRVHLLDGTFELYRAHFSKRPRHSLDNGTDVKATVGVVQSLLQLLEDPHEAVTHLAIAFDNPIRSFRNDLFEDYKSDAGVLPELRAQFDLVEQATRALGVVTWSMRDFEADDALATAAAKFAADPRVEQVRILSPDKDLGQCLFGDRVVQVDRIRNTLFTEASQLEHKGLVPQSVPDFLALVGDTADGIPGIEGWGEKTSAKVLGAYQHLEHIPADAKVWAIQVRGAERLAQTLSTQRADAMLYRLLATVRRDVPLDETLEELEWRGPHQSVWFNWTHAMQTPRLKDRPRRWR